MNVHVITAADQEGTLWFYVIPEKRAGEIVDICDLDDFDGIIEEFLSIKGYTDWVQENDSVTVTSYWEARRP
jgi:hypothetical protein